MTETNTSNKLSLPVLCSYLLLLAALVGVDQWSKMKVLETLSDGTVRSVIPNLVQFRYVQNTGAAFSVLSGNTLFLAVLTAIILAVALVLLVLGKIPGRGNQLAALLMIAGGTGNLIDRVHRHYVVDFIETLFTDFAVFNFADCCVTIGAAVLILSTIISFVKDLRTAQD